MGRSVAVVAVVMSVGMMSTGVAAAVTDPSWAVQSTPNPSQSSGLLGVSCSSGTACTAVGSYVNSAAVSVTLAEHWNGTKWTVQSTPNPSGAQYSQLLGVSCSSGTACTAVGSYENSSAVFVTLAEHWNGTKWTVQSTPNPSGARYSELEGVSCSSGTACTAVGDYVNSARVDVTLAEHGSYTKWTIQSTPNPSGAQSSDLLGVSCSSGTACTAVGDYVNSAAVAVTLAERWNGTKWTVQSTPNPSGAQFSVLVGVSCSSGTACTAVGAYDNSAAIGDYVKLAEHWNGTNWTIQSTPNPSGAQGSLLQGVSCSSGTACTAVGGYENSSAGVVTLAERHS